MPAIRAHDDPVLSDLDDDDGMPPLVDNPAGMPPLVDNPNPSMTFTFSTSMTPITFSTDPTTYEISSDSTLPIPNSPVLDDGAISGRSSHTKKRDASYIPRPPNAFILFRSSFIKSQQVPGKVEGNHSTLSKIIGMYWKTLPREEREVWEAKALVAQAEHRKRYPDWRFRPGANALAKLKTKDGGGGGSGGGHKRKGSHGQSQSRKGRIKEERCAKIAGLLVEGKTGLDLAEAVRKWEGDGVNGSVQRNVDGAIASHQEQPDWESGKEGGILLADVKVDMPACDGPVSAKEAVADNTVRCTRCKTPDATYDHRFKVPLTAMFKRSLSAPASHSRCPCPDGDAAQQQHCDTGAVDYCDSPSTAFESPTRVYTPPNDVREVADPMECLPPLLISPMFADQACTWNDPFVPVDQQGHIYDIPTPSDSPCDGPFNHILYMDGNYNQCPSQPLCTDIIDPTYSPQTQSVQAYSNYSTLADWAGPGPLSLVSPLITKEGHPYDWPQIQNGWKEKERELQCYSQGLEAYNVDGISLGL